ncbi:MAG: hypothetical protein WD512_01585, partial [Candidatus Paceibacterota bacterium]
MSFTNNLNAKNPKVNNRILPVSAIAVFTGISNTNDTVLGQVIFTEDLTLNRVKIELNLINLKPNSLHGFHVHEAGDLSD